MTMPHATAPDFWPQALRLAEQAVGLTDPNPRVGCVIVAPDGRTVLAQGHTQAAGQAHAEAAALQQAAARGIDVRGATAWVTLEPCAHHGRTPPCCDALVRAGIASVHVATGDPNPLVNGQGTARLRAAGIAVHAAPPEVEAAARELNIGFFHRMRTGRPWVRLKIAASLDGLTALPDGQSQWITGEAARVDGHAWRRRAGAVLTGSGTVLADDPLLDVRHVPTARQPRRAVIDGALRTPPGARMLAPARADAALPGAAALPLRIYTTNGALDGAGDRAAALRAAGAELRPVRGLDHRDGHALPQLDLAAVIDDLGQWPVNELHVEAGAGLNGALLAADLVDELLVYLAPCLLGQGRGMSGLGPLASLAERVALQWHSITPVGSDLRLLARRVR